MTSDLLPINRNGLWGAGHFNGTFRDECLDENWFESLEQARKSIATWRTDYNEIRPHSSCGRVPPANFAALHRQITGDAKQESKTDTGIS